MVTAGAQANTTEGNQSLDEEELSPLRPQTLGLRGRVLGVLLPAPLPTPRALPDRGALWPLAIGVEKDLGGIDV